MMETMPHPAAARLRAHVQMLAGTIGERNLWRCEYRRLRFLFVLWRKPESWTELSVVRRRTERQCRTLL